MVDWGRFWVPRASHSLGYHGDPDGLSPRLNVYYAFATRMYRSTETTKFHYKNETFQRWRAWEVFPGVSLFGCFLVGLWSASVENRRVEARLYFPPGGTR